MSNTISLTNLAKKSYEIDLDTDNYRAISVEDGETGEKDRDLYINSFRKTIKPFVLRYMTENERYLIPQEYEECILQIYDLVEGGDKTLRKIANKKYVKAKELKEAIDNLNISQDKKEKILYFLEYEIRLKLDEIKDKITEKTEFGLNYILSPNTDYESDTMDPKILNRQDKKKEKEEILSINDKLEILEYIDKKYDEFNFNLLCLVNDIANSRKEEKIEKIGKMIERFSYWE